MKRSKRTFEIQILAGRRIVGSFKVTAKDYADADAKSTAERKRRGCLKYRIREFSATAPRHGGYHDTAFVFDNHR